MSIKTAISRFHIHDELTAPEKSLPIVKAVLSSGAMSKFLGVLAGAPAALRAYTRMRSELRAGGLPAATRVRIALAVAEARGDGYGLAQQSRLARAAGLSMDEIARARGFDSADERQAALLRYLRAARDGQPPLYLHEEAREIGWTDEQILEALAGMALSDFESLIAGAAELPLEQAAPADLLDAA